MYSCSDITSRGSRSGEQRGPAYECRPGLRGLGEAALGRTQRLSSYLRIRDTFQYIRMVRSSVPSRIRLDVILGS